MDVCVHANTHALASMSYTGRLCDRVTPHSIRPFKLLNQHLVLLLLRLGWQRLVGTLYVWDSAAKEPYNNRALFQMNPSNSGSLRSVVTTYLIPASIMVRV